MKSKVKVRACNFFIDNKEREEFFVKANEVFDSSYYTLGEKTKEFERKFAEHHKMKYSTAFSCASAALETLLRDLNKGGEVIVPTNTNFATAAVVLRAGYKLKFADIDISTLSLSLDTIKSAITDNTTGIIIVHVGGIISPEIYKIKEFCVKNELFFIEDAAHAHGSFLDKLAAGSFGIGAAYSFHPGKLITCGEGGLLITNSLEIYEESLKYRDQGRNVKNDSKHEVMGYSWRLSEISACLGIIQTENIEKNIEHRRNIAKIYDKEIAKIRGVKKFDVPLNLRYNYHKYIVLVDKGINIKVVYEKMLNEYGVELSSGVYTQLCHKQPVFEEYSLGEFSVAETFSESHICLPINTGMTTDQCKYVIDSLERVISSMIE